jgi:hypothetical protein
MKVLCTKDYYYDKELFGRNREENIYKIERGA